MGTFLKNLNLTDSTDFIRYKSVDKGGIHLRTIPVLTDKGRKFSKQISNDLAKIEGVKQDDILSEINSIREKIKLSKKHPEAEKHQEEIEILKKYGTLEGRKLLTSLAKRAETQKERGSVKIPTEDEISTLRQKRLQDGKRHLPNKFLETILITQKLKMDRDDRKNNYKGYRPAETLTPLNEVIKGAFAQPMPNPDSVEKTRMVLASAKKTYDDNTALLITPEVETIKAHLEEHKMGKRSFDDLSNEEQIYFYLEQWAREQPVDSWINAPATIFALAEHVGRVTGKEIKGIKNKFTTNGVDALRRVSLQAFKTAELEQKQPVYDLSEVEGAIFDSLERKVRDGNPLDTVINDSGYLRYLGIGPGKGLNTERIDEILKSLEKKGVMRLLRELDSPATIAFKKKRLEIRAKEDAIRLQEQKTQQEIKDEKEQLERQRKNRVEDQKTRNLCEPYERQIKNLAEISKFNKLDYVYPLSGPYTNNKSKRITQMVIRPKSKNANFGDKLLQFDWVKEPGGNYKLVGLRTDTSNIALNDDGQIESITITSYPRTAINLQLVEPGTYNSRSGFTLMSKVLSALQFLNADAEVRGIFEKKLHLQPAA